MVYERPRKPLLSYANVKAASRNRRLGCAVVDKLNLHHHSYVFLKRWDVVILVKVEFKNFAAQIN